LQECPSHLVWSDDDARGFSSARRWHDHPISDIQGVRLWLKVVDAAGVPEADTDHALGRRSVVLPAHGVFIATAACADLLAGLQPIPKSLPRPRAGFIEGGRGIPSRL
jgi:hypothetical protein